MKGDLFNSLQIPTVSRMNAGNSDLEHLSSIFVLITLSSSLGLASTITMKSYFGITDNSLRLKKTKKSIEFQDKQ